MNVRRKQIRNLVEGLLAEHGQTGPPIDVRQLADGLGVVMRSAPIDDDISGFLYSDADSGKVVIGVNRNHSRTRQRFTMAHEIGHLFLHSFESELHCDDGGYGHGFGRLRLRDQLASTGEDRDEVEANYFAAELLMPQEMLTRELESGAQWDLLDEKKFDVAIRTLAQKFVVSPQALTIRLVRLGLIHAPM